MDDLTTGPVSRHLFRTAGFMLVTMITQTLYFLVDLYWVGQLGKQAVAGVSVAGNLTFIVLAISQMLGVGTTALVSHAAGRKDRDRTRLLFNQSQALALFVGALFFVVSMAFRMPYARALGADTATAALAGEYLLYFLPAMALQFALVAMGAALRGIGVFKPGMIVQTATVAINMVLAPVLMFGWGTGRPMGVAGTALATFIAVAVGVVWLTRYFVGPKAYLTVVSRDLKPQPALWRAMLKIGLPTGAEFGLLAAYLMIVYAVTRPFGAEAQAGFGIGLRIVQALFMPVVALGFAVAPVAGQNFGARHAARVKGVFRTASLMAGSVMFAAALLCNIAPAALIGLFSRDPSVIAVGDEYLRIISWNFVASGLIYVSSSLFQALGNTLPSLAASISRLAIIAVPLVPLSRHPDFSLRWVWYLSVAAIYLQLAVSWLLLRREFRRRVDPLSASPLPGSAPAAG